MEIRHPTGQEHDNVDALVQAVVDEIYSDLWTGQLVPIGVTDWSPAWVALMKGELAGVALTSGESLDDLWVAAKARGMGVGQALLRRCESEIRERTIHRAKLRVLSSNLKAISFYKSHGWIATREYPHEKFPVMVTDMRKDL